MGVPHLAVGKIESAEPGAVEVSGWFCPETLRNLETNPSVSVTAREGHEGYQVVGRVEKSAVDAVLDGYAPEEDRRVPQVRYRLRIRLDKVMEMGDRPHADVEVPVEPPKSR
jgi:hypothetical protein